MASRTEARFSAPGENFPPKGTAPVFPGGTPSPRIMEHLHGWQKTNLSVETASLILYGILFIIIPESQIFHTVKPVAMNGPGLNYPLLLPSAFI
jgi:hypothetical protein